MAKIPVKGGAGSSRGIPRVIGRSSRSIGEAGIEAAFGSLIPIGFKSISNFSDGLRSPTTAWKRQLTRIKNNLTTVGTGKRYDMKGNVVKQDTDMSWYNPKQITNRVGAALSVPFNVGAVVPLIMAGQSVRYGVGVPLKAAAAVAPHAARAVGMTAYEGSRVTGQVINGGVKALRAPGVMDLAMAGTLVGGTAIGLGLAINEIGGGNKNFNGYASGLQGTLGMAPTPLVDTGANGDLVFAMHKMR